VNVYGQIAVTQAFLPLLREGNGRVVNIGSMSGKVSLPFVGPYAASKFSMEALTEALCSELCSWRIPVSMVTPGNIDTPLWEKSLGLAEQVRRELPDRAEELYGPAMELLYSAVQREHGRVESPETVARAVLGALTAKRPRWRYTVGADAKLASLALKFLPNRLGDWLIRRLTGLNRLVRQNQ
jgi:NAD(P)-dependent dehydrogenase (short-subunit alcohol dehydrogenase family)